MNVIKVPFRKIIFENADGYKLDLASGSAQIFVENLQSFGVDYDVDNTNLGLGFFSENRKKRKIQKITMDINCATYDIYYMFSDYFINTHQKIKMYRYNSDSDYEKKPYCLISITSTSYGEKDLNGRFVVSLSIDQLTPWIFEEYILSSVFGGGVSIPFNFGETDDEGNEGIKFLESQDNVFNLNNTTSNIIPVKIKVNGIFSNFKWNLENEYDYRVDYLNNYYKNGLINSSVLVDSELIIDAIPTNSITLNGDDVSSLQSTGYSNYLFIPPGFSKLTIDGLSSGSVELIGGNLKDDF